VTTDSLLKRLPSHRPRGIGDNSIWPTILAFVVVLALMSGRWDITRLIFDEETAERMFAQQKYPYAWSLHYWEWQLRFYTQVLCCGFVALVLYMRIPRIGEIPKWFFMTLLPLVGYLSMSVLWSATPDNGIVKIIDLLYVLALLISLNVLQTRIDLRGSLTDVLLLVSILMAVGALAVSIVGSSSGRFAAFGGGPNVFGRTMAFGNILALDKLSKPGRPYKYAIVVAVTFVMLLASGSRGALVGWMVGVTVFLHARRPKLTILASRLVFVFAIAVLFLFTSNAGKSIVELAKVRYGEETLQNRYLSHRDELAIYAFTMWQSQPIEGCGLGAFAGHSPGGQEYPHNMILELLSEGGGIATLCFFCMLWFSIRELTRSRDGWSGALVSLFGTSLVCAQFSGDLYDSRNVFVFMMLAVYRPFGNGQPRNANTHRTTLFRWKNATLSMQARRHG
jgi:O-antigen ligase